MNTTKTIVLMVGLTVLLVFIGGALGGRQGMIFAFIFACAMNMFSYWFSDKIVLRMYNAREVTEAEAPMLWGVTHDLALKMNMPMPKVYVIPSDAPNAFATGRNPNHAAVAATEGILRLLNARGTRRRHGARTGPRSQSRHSDRNHCRSHRRRHQHDRQHGAVGHDLRRFGAPRRSREARAA